MPFRKATIEDIPALQVVRLSVKENVLSDPARITASDYEEYLVKRGAGWVCVIDGEVVGFSIVDLEERNVWALFVHPGHQAKGIGQELHDLMLHYYFTHTDQTLWLSTDPDTRAAAFYRKNGWQEKGYMAQELRFEMSLEEWEANSARRGAGR